MFDYFKDSEFVINRVYFEYSGARYVGRGVMRWCPDDGFRIDAPLERHGSPLPETRDYGKVGVLTGKDLPNVRLRFSGSSRGLVPHAEIDDLRVQEQKHLSLNLDSITMWETGYSGDTNKYVGSALLEFARPPILPDRLHVETRVQDKVIGERCGTSLRFEDERWQIVCTMPNRTHVEAHWQMSADRWHRHDCWLVGPAMQDVFSILTGQTVQLLWRKMRRGGSIFTELRKREAPRSLGILSPMGTDPRVDKMSFLHFVRFFMAGGPHVHVCQRILSQLASAMIQNNWQAQELLVSTILEAALRTLDDQPFIPDDKSWNIRESMDCFCEKYLSKEWKQKCNDVLTARKNLRHRNAHPDWLTKYKGAESLAEIEQAFDDMVLLSRFYGYLMLALAGFERLEPRFPVPHKSWRPLFSIGKPPGPAHRG